MGKWFRLLFLFTVILAPAGLAAQATGRIVGQITEAGTGRALAGAQVFVNNTNIGAQTDAQGRFQLANVPPGQRTVRVSLVGFQNVDRPVTVTAGQVATLNVALAAQAVQLQELVVTGVSGATSRAKVPFTIAKVSSEQLNQAPTTNAASALQGKVAGASVVSGSGRPGGAPSILLRGPKSINAAGRSQEPLYIVDGVILGTELVDIASLDIESIEVVKGAAASSLYGSRAANGVVQIRTRRGSQITDDQVQYTVRSEYGNSNLPNDFWLTQSHNLRMTADRTKFVDQQGRPCDYLKCSSVQLAGQRAAPGQTANAWNSYQIERWPGQTFNQVDRFFTGGNFLQNYVSASGRSGATNFHVSWNNLRDEGVEIGHGGLSRNNFRVNLDQNVRSNIQVSASAFYSRAESDPREGEIFNLTRMPAGVDLTACADDPTKSCADDPQNLILLADPQNPESPNPLYDMLNREYDEDRDRFLGSTDLRWSPLSWLDVAGNASYDRLNRSQTNYYPKGYRTINPSTTLNNGLLSQDEFKTDAFNASVTATGTFDFGESIRNRTQFRYLFEQQNRLSAFTRGYEFAVGDLPTFTNLNQENLLARSSEAPIRADGYYAITNFDILDRYIVDALVRNDGSSLFGPEERRQWYYRLAGAWRVSQEPWFTFPGLDELKLRYAYGTAGNRPNFSAQYETYAVTGGRIRPVNLGNRALKPEFSAEQEAGVDASFFNGIATLGVTYANTRTSDQILPVPLPAYTGFETQWRNAGTLESDTWEASLDARLVERGSFRWSTRLLFDQTRSTITELDVPPFNYGIPSDQGLERVYYARKGERLGTFYGVKFAQSCADLPKGTSCDGFAVNDEGFLVYVGAGGFGNPQWGTAAPTRIRGAQVMWGTPFAGECTDRSTGENTLYCPLGNSLPDFKVSFSNNISFGGLSLYGLIDSEQGFDVYNLPLQWAVFRRTAGVCDQSGMAEAQQKPIGYCDALYGVSGLNPSTAFVEDGSYVKLRELSLRYRLGESTLDRLPGISTFSAATFSLTGRNLKTWTDYRGYDPEVGRTGGDTGSAALARVEGYTYPNFRTWTLGVELNF